jgi:hypothetical protein
LGTMAYQDSDNVVVGNLSADGAVVINESGADVDFRIESDTRTNAFFLDGATGTVGIGTSSPNDLLDLSATSTPILRFTQTGDGAYARIFSTAGNFYLNADYGNTGGRSMIFRIGGTTERMRIDSIGRVGIGTSSPAAMLDIQGGTYGLSIGSRLLSSQSDIALTSNSVINGDTSLNLCANSFLSFYTGTTDRLTGTAGGTERMRIDSSGRVGIGTSNPQQKLEIGTTSDSENTITLKASTTGTNKIFFSDGTGAALYAGFLEYQHTNNTLGFGTASSERMRIDSSGNVGIGTSSPGTELDVNGDITADGIYLGGTGAANYLDDYEEGTWTVTWNSLSGTPSNTTAYYRKIGGIVYWVYNTGASSISATANSTNITGFPFSGQYASTGVGISSGTGSVNTGMFYSGGSPAFWMTSFSSGGNSMTYSGFYFTAA